MTGRYNFEFFRHKCGRTISIHGEECACEKPGFIEPSILQQETTVEKATKTMRSLRRLLRRARAHNHHPVFVKIEGSQGHAVALFAGRHIRIRDDGSFVPDMLPRHVNDIRKVDPHWSSSCFGRWHTMEMNSASWCRKQGWKRQARNSIEQAKTIRERGDLEAARV